MLLAALRSSRGLVLGCLTLLAMPWRQLQRDASMCYQPLVLAAFDTVAGWHIPTGRRHISGWERMEHKGFMPSDGDVIMTVWPKSGTHGDSMDLEPAPGELIPCLASASSSDFHTLKQLLAGWLWKPLRRGTAPLAFQMMSLALSSMG